MAMIDSFFGKGAFKGAKCKTLLKLTIPRIKLLRNRREILLKQMRKDIAKLLESGQEATARIRVEHIIREENMMEAQEIIELFCELITVRLPIIETQRECPLDLKEAISSICFSALRCSDLPELLQIQMLFTAKYGKEFVAAATELRPDCGVNRQIIEKLSVRAPSVEAKLKLLKEIAEEHGLDWDPSETESELLKPHEDLLNGSAYFSGSNLPLPKEKEEEPLYFNSTREASHEGRSVSPGFDDFDLPEVPKVSVQSFSSKPAAPEAASSLETGLDPEPEEMKPAPYEELLYEATPPIDARNPSSLTFEESKPSGQFNSFPGASPTPISPNLKEAAPLSASIPEAHIEEPVSYASHTKYCSSEDLQDVLVAAHAAAETAERAAAAARAAASLAQVRITELVNRRGVIASNNTFNEGIGPLGPSEDQVNKQVKDLSGSPHFKVQKPDPQLYQRTGSLDDDPYYSYPNLFKRQDSNLNPVFHLPKEDQIDPRDPN